MMSSCAQLPARSFRNGRLLLAAAVAAAIVATLLLHRHDPNAANSPFLPCVFQAISGFWCAGCGITRALHALVHGDLIGALDMNPLAIILLPFASLALLWNAGWQPRWAAPIINFIAQPMLWAAVVPTYWIARNLPWPPFSWLAPG